MMRYYVRKQPKLAMENDVCVPRRTHTIRKRRGAQGNLDKEARFLSSVKDTSYTCTTHTHTLTQTRADTAALPWSEFFAICRTQVRSEGVKYLFVYLSSIRNRQQSMRSFALGDKCILDSALSHLHRIICTSNFHAIKSASAIICSPK